MIFTKKTIIICYGKPRKSIKLENKSWKEGKEMIGYLELSCKTNLTPLCFSWKFIKKRIITLVMWQMSHVKGLASFYFLGINLIFDLFFISDLPTSISKNHENRHKHVKQIQKWQKTVLKILYTALKFYLHFRHLFWTSTTGPSS